MFGLVLSYLLCAALYSVNSKNYNKIIVIIFLYVYVSFSALIHFFTLTYVCLLFSLCILSIS